METITGYKICPNGHCYEDTRTDCRWCGESTVAGRLGSDVEMFHKTLYVGRKEKDYVLTDNENIEHIEAKITVDHNSDYKFYFHMSGENPHPFNVCIIHFKKLTIEGRELTKMCEEIIDGKQTEINLSDKKYVSKTSLHRLCFWMRLIQ
jgi:hypothetical protein